MDLLEREDSLMADKGFQIQYLCTSYGVRVNTPPLWQGDRQMLPADVVSTKKIAGVQIRVERKMQRIKLFPFCPRSSQTVCLTQLG